MQVQLEGKIITIIEKNIHAIISDIHNTIGTQTKKKNAQGQLAKTVIIILQNKAVKKHLTN